MKMTYTQMRKLIEAGCDVDVTQEMPNFLYTKSGDIDKRCAAYIQMIGKATKVIVIDNTKAQKANSTKMKMFNLIMLFCMAITLNVYARDTKQEINFVSPVAEAKEVIVSGQKQTIEDLFNNCDWDKSTMIAVAMSENGYEMYDNTWGETRTYSGNTDGSTDTGILMINSNTFRDFVNRGLLTGNEDLTVAEDNVSVGCTIWGEQGYGAWTDHRNGKFRKYLAWIK